MRLSVIVPLNNEEENVIPPAEAIIAALAKLRGRFRLILIDHASGPAGHRNTESIIASGEVSGIALESAVIQGVPFVQTGWWKVRDERAVI